MEVSNGSLQRVTLKNIEPTIFNAIIIGVIIAKQDSRQFIDNKNSETGGSTRGVINLTFRDSPQDFINVTFWGTSQTILKIEENFHIGDVIELVRPQIFIRKYNDNNEQYRPKVTSPYSLTMNENLSSILHYEGRNVEYYQHLLHLPTKPPCFVPIRDIHKDGLKKKDTNVDILGAINNVGKERTIQLKNGGCASLVEIILFDQTNPGIRISIWNREYIKRSLNWKSRETILFITDLKVDWSGYHKTVVAKLGNQSIVTENPTTREAEILRKFALTAPLTTLTILDQLVDNLPNVETIQNVMSIRQIQNKLNLATRDANIENFAALIYCFVTQLDLDGFGRIILKKCKHCKSLIREQKCINESCPIAQSEEFVEPEISFDIRMTISDHTGSLTNCRLNGRAAEKVLGCTAEQFVQMPDEHKSKLKWKFLLERCAIRIIVFSINNQKPIVSIQSCTIPDTMQVVQDIPVY